MRRHYWFVLLAWFLAGIVLVTAGCSYRRTYKESGEEGAPKTEIATVAVPAYMEVATINGESTGKWAEKLFVSGVEKELELLPGFHTISVIYLDIWPIDDNDSAKLRSKPLDLLFTAEPGRKYRIVGQEPEDLESARNYESNFTAHIVDADTGEKVSR